MMMLSLRFGSPTAELFAASYNNTGKSETVILKLGNSGYGYTNFTSGGFFKPEYNHGIYNNGSSAPWLASPDSYSPYCVVAASMDGWLVCGGTSTECALRPVVCLPASIFNDKYATDTTLVNQ